MRTSFTLITLALATINSWGQEEKTVPLERSNRIFRHKHISFVLATNWTQKAKTTNGDGPYTLNAKTIRGWEAGFNYYIHVRDKSYSFVTGLHGRAIPRNHELFIPKEDFTPVRQADFEAGDKLTRIFDLHFYLPMVIEKRWADKKNRLLEH